MAAARSGAVFDLHKLMDIYQPDLGRIELAKQRQTSVWRGELPDKRPVFFNAPLSDVQEKIPNRNLKECFYDSNSMLCSQVRLACEAANARSDAVPSIRANTGTGTLLACLGLEQIVFEDKMPWLQDHLTREQAARLKPDDIKIQGTFELALNHMRRYKEIMGDILPVYCPDTQGPFDLAHLMLGDDIFYALYDDPPLVHHILELCVELGIKTHTWAKEVSGEPLDQQYHGNNLYAENMGIRICEDTAVLLSPGAINDFVMPYSQKLARHFGGAWVHYCGRNDHLTAALCAIPEVRGINFGVIPGNEYEHRFEDDMKLMHKSGKVSIGYWPRFPNEKGREYLERLHKWASLGCLIPDASTAIGEPDGFIGAADALEYWYNL